MLKSELLCQPRPGGWAMFYIHKSHKMLFFGTCWKLLFWTTPKKSVFLSTWLKFLFWSIFLWWEFVHNTVLLNLKCFFKYIWDWLQSVVKFFILFCKTNLIYIASSHHSNNDWRLSPRLQMDHQESHILVSSPLKKHTFITPRSDMRCSTNTNFFYILMSVYDIWCGRPWSWQ